MRGSLPGLVQGPPENRLRSRNTQGRHRKSATDWPGSEARTDGALPVKVCIFGAGAIGGYIGVKLALSGTDTSFIARGANLAAIKKNGLRLRNADPTFFLAPHAPDG